MKYCLNDLGVFMFFHCVLNCTFLAASVFMSSINSSCAVSGTSSTLTVNGLTTNGKHLYNNNFYALQ